MERTRFERIVLAELEAAEGGAIPADYLAMRTGVPIEVAERELGRLLERGAVRARVGREGELLYCAVYVRRPIRPEPPTLEPPGGTFTLLGLSVLLPGAGHFYAGRPLAGTGWMVATLAAYACFLVPGPLVHALCLASASRLQDP